MDHHLHHAPSWTPLACTLGITATDSNTLAECSYTRQLQQALLQGATATATNHPAFILPAASS